MQIFINMGLKTEIMKTDLINLVYQHNSNFSVRADVEVVIFNIKC